MTTPLAGPAELRTIVHPTDFSPASDLAFAHALKLALAARAKLYILHTEREVAGEDIDWSSFPGVRRTLAKWRLLEEDSPPEAVFERLGVAIAKVDVLDREPVNGIVRFLDEHRSDLMVLATHGRDGWQRWLRGSVAEPVARHARMPALFLPHGARGFVDPETGAQALRRILVPIDATPHPQRALELARTLADALGASGVALFLLHVGEAGSAPAVEPGPGWGTVETIVRTGGVVDSIAGTTSELEADLVVMATAGHQGFLDALRGSTTEQVLRRLERPVLAVPATKV